MEHIEKLKESLNQEIKLHPNYPDLANMLGLLLSLEGRHAEALKQYDRALGINPNYAECKANRAFVLAALGKGEEAIKAATDLAEAAPGDHDVLIVCGKVLAWQGEKAKARALLEKAVELKPDCPATYHYLGLALLPDDESQASMKFERAATLGSAYIALYDSLHIYKKGRIRLAKPAVKSLLKQLAENPNTVKVYLSTAKMLASEGLFDSASSQFEKARAIESDSARVENGLGLVATAREYGEEAKLHFRRALQFDPENVTAHVNLAFQLGADGNIKEAEEELRRAVELAPRYPDIRVQLAIILTEREEFDEAISHLREALAINPKYIFAAFMLGSILFTAKRYQEVIDTYAKMDVDRIALPEIYSHLATSHLELSQNGAALEIAKKAISQESALPSSYACLVIAYHRLGKHKDALASAREYMRLFPEGPEIEEIHKLHKMLENTAGE
jgi:tetratricopeptide (TPR) repeat protein